MNMFKNKVDTYIRRACYTQMKHVGLSISQWLPCPFATWAFVLDVNVVNFFLNLCRAILISQFFLKYVHNKGEMHVIAQNRGNFLKQTLI